MEIKLVIADDHEIVRGGIAAILDQTNISIVGEAESSSEVVKLVARTRPDVLLLDVRLTDNSGLRTLGQVMLLDPNPKVLLFSAYENPAYVARAYAMGAKGYLQKSVHGNELIDAIQLVAAGGDLWKPEDLRRLTAALSTRTFSDDIEVSLTNRESQVLRYLVSGSKNKDIAAELEISPETVKEHVQHILRKAGVADRTQAAVWAVRHELV